MHPFGPISLVSTTVGCPRTRESLKVNAPRSVWPANSAGPTFHGKLVETALETFLLLSLRHTLGRPPQFLVEVSLPNYHSIPPPDRFPLFHRQRIRPRKSTGGMTVVILPLHRHLSPGVLIRVLGDLTMVVPGHSRGVRLGHNVVHARTCPFLSRTIDFYSPFLVLGTDSRMTILTKTHLTDDGTTMDLFWRLLPLWSGYTRWDFLCFIASFAGSCSPHCGIQTIF